MPVQTFCYYLAVANIQLCDYEQGQRVWQEYAAAYEEGSFNWFKWQELYFLLALHTRHYGEAFRPGKFMNEVPVFSKDKRGVNIPILIAQFLAPPK